MRRGLLLLPLLALAVGCGTGSGVSAGSGRSEPGAPSGSSATTACVEVRLGIDAFNRGDFETTVDHFVAAVPLAQAEDDGSPAADQLIDAVEYYAALPPERYLEAAQTSPDFAKYKAITLGQCAGGPPVEDSPGQLT